MQCPVTEASVLRPQLSRHCLKFPSYFGCPLGFMREAMHPCYGDYAPPVYRLREVASALPLSATTTHFNSIHGGVPSGAIHAGQVFVVTRRGGLEDRSTKLGVTLSAHTMLGWNNFERQSAFLDN